VAAGLVAVLLIAAAVAFALTRGDGDDGDVATDAPATTSAPAEAAPPETEAETTTTAAEETTTTTTTTPSTTATTTEATAPAAAEVSAGDLEDAATRYYDLVAAGDLDAAWALLTPRYQRETSRESYDDFWGEQIESVEVQGRPRGDAEAGTVALTLRYETADGSSTENVLVGFVQQGDALLIDDYQTGVG
jgi:hypothetical protein